MNIAHGTGCRNVYPRRYRLTKTDEFSSVFGFRRAIRGQFFMLHFMPRPEAGGPGRLGLVIGKKLLKRAVDRNLVKRIGRENFRLTHSRLGGYDLILRLISRPPGNARVQIATEIVSLFAKLRSRAGESEAVKDGER